MAALEYFWSLEIADETTLYMEEFATHTQKGRTCVQQSMEDHAKKLLNDLFIY